METTAKKAGWIFLLIILVYIPAQFLLGLVLAKVEVNIYVLLFISQLLFVVPGLIGLFIVGKKPRELMVYKKIGFIDVLLMIGLTYCVVPLVAVINLLSMLVSSSGTESVSETISNIPVLLGIIFVALVPAVFEELIFRGIIYGSYRRNGVLKAALLSGLLFGLMHMNFNQFCYAFVLGVILVFVLEATGSMIAPMIMHFTLNANSIILSWGLQKLLRAIDKAIPGYSDSTLNTIGDGMDRMQMLMGLIVYVPVAAISCTVGFFAFRALAKRNGRWDHIGNIFKQKTAASNFSVPLLVSIIVSAGFIVVSMIVLG